MRTNWIARGVLALAFGILCGGVAAADEKKVAQEILEILRANNQISAQQYEALLSKATAEESTQHAAVKTQPNSLNAYWKDGLRLDGGEDQQFKLQIGGRILSHWSYFDEDDDVQDQLGGLGSGTEFRSARLYMAGSLYDRVGFKGEYEFDGGTVQAKDVYIEILKLPWVGTLRMGHFREPYALVGETSLRFTTFIEKATLKDAFVPDRNVGIMLYNHAFDKRMTWAIGGFREADDQGKSINTDSAYNTTMRFTGLPWYEDEGRKLIHLGLSYSHKFRHNDEIRFSARPEAHAAPRFVDTKGFASNGADLINPEFALVYGPFAVQAEYSHAFVDATEGANPNFSGYYGQVSYFLTGEHRQYKQTGGAFDRPQPKRNFDGHGGWGAWEIASRYSNVDLQDEAIRGGKLGVFTTGLNWYLNPNMRLSANYGLADISSVGNTNIFQVRAQVDF